MASFLNAYDAVLSFLGPALFYVGAFAAVLFAVDWAARTRRLDPSSSIARTVRSILDPITAPIERRIVRAGGLPSSAPWWTLAAVVLGGLIVMWILGFIRTQLIVLYGSGARGVPGMLALAIHWTFAILKLAILVRVISTWISISPFSPWVRWSYVVSEPILRPLRQIIPTIGMLDISPIAAYLLLSFTEGLLLRLL